MNILPYFTEAPWWVWPLFSTLVYMGWQATKDRERRIWSFMLLPLFVILSLNTVSESPQPTLAWLFFAAGYASGAVSGYSFQETVIIARTPGRVQVRGEWVTLSMSMAIFWLAYADAVLKIIAPETMATGGAIVLVSAVSGGLSGGFAGRALCILRAPVTSAEEAQL